MYIVQCIMHRSPNKHLSPLKDIRSETKFDADVLDQIDDSESENKSLQRNLSGS